MKFLQNFEVPAFAILIVVLGYALFVLAPPTALFEYNKVETYAGISGIVFSVILVILRLLPERRLRLERSLYAVFLAGMPLVYFVAAAMSGTGMTTEIIGVSIYAGLALVGLRRSFVVLGLDIIAHGIGWDLWHDNSEPYIAAWYPPVCLVTDLALGFLALTQAGAHGIGPKADVSDIDQVAQLRRGGELHV